MTELAEIAAVIKPVPHPEALIQSQAPAVQTALKHLIANEWDKVSASTCYLYPNKLNHLLMELGYWTQERADMIDLLYEAMEDTI